ncbi:MAG: hypothetical protein WCJ58_03265 [bacterium]
MQGICIISLISAVISCVATVMISLARRDPRKSKAVPNPNIDITIDI